MAARIRALAYRARRPFRAGPVGAQLLVLGVAVAVCFPVLFFSLEAVQDSQERATKNARAAVLGAQIETAAAELRAILMPDVSSAEPRELTPAEAIEAQRVLFATDEHAQELHQLLGSAPSVQALGAVEDTQAALIALAEAGTPAARLALDRSLADLTAATTELPVTLSAQAAHQAGRFHALVRTAAIALAVLAVAAAAGVAVTTWVMGRRLTRQLQTTEERRAELAAATTSLERRNAQFRSLYQVVSEVGETLSVTYVAQTALGQIGPLVGAEGAELRVLRGATLELVGTSIGEEGAVVTAADALAGADGTRGSVPLGDGLCGRVSRRGRSLRVGEDAAAAMAPGESVPWAEAAMIVPLIVGARVVGTLAAWSARTDAFSDDDLQILEMLASQVATAVVAAETAEDSDEQAHTDPLTGLPNRRSLMRDATAPYANALAAGQSVAVAMLDLDHFKRFNDEYGHRVGDIALQRVADVIRATLREDDRAYRYGGEEFTIVLPGADGATAPGILERLRAAVARTPLLGSELAPALPVTVSIGLAIGPEHGTGIEQLVRAADQALYTAKSAGRDRVRVFGRSEDDHAAREPDAAA